MKKTSWITVLVGVTAVLVTGCTSFEKDWRQARQQPTPDADIGGAWTGTWQNTNNAHGGALRAVVTPSGADSYAARFHATWGSHRGSFRTELKGVREGDDFVFEGRKRILGFLLVIGCTPFAHQRFKLAQHTREVFK